MLIIEALSEESLNKLTKPEIVAAYMNLQTKMTKMESNMINEVRKLNGNLEKIRSELDVTKNVNSLLSDRLTTISDKNCETRTPSPFIRCWLQVCLLISGLACLAWLLQAWYNIESGGRGGFWVTLTKPNVFLWTFL